MKKLLVLLALLFGIARADAQDWQWLNPKPQANTLRSIAFTDQDNGIAVGDGGAIVRTTNGGASWISLPLATFSGLLSVSFPTALTGYAAGLYGTVLKTTDGGATWTMMTSNIPQKHQQCSFPECGYRVCSLRPRSYCQDS